MVDKKVVEEVSLDKKVVEEVSLDKKSNDSPETKNLNGTFTPYLTLSILIAVFSAAFQQGYQNSLFNTPEVVVKNFYKDVYGESMTDSLLTSLWSITSGFVPLGGAIGALASGYLADKVGRKRGLWIVNVLVFISGILLVISKSISSYITIIIGRFIAGLYCGLFSGILPLFLNEISPINLRGTTGTLNQLFNVIGSLTANILGLKQILGTASLWPVLVGFIMVPGLCGIGLIAVEETPKYLYGKNKEAAEKALLKFRGSKNKELVQNELESYSEEQSGSKDQSSVKWSDFLKVTHLRRSLIVTIFIQMSQQLSGINAVILFSTEIFKDAGFDDELSTYCSILLSVVNLIMTFVCLILIEKTGRRILLLIGMVGMCLSCFGLGLFLTLIDRFKGYTGITIVAIIFAVLFIVFFAIGPGAIPWLITSELFDSNSRGKASSVACFVNWGCNTLVCFLFPFIKDAIGTYSFFIFGGILVFFALFVMFFIPETKGRKIEEIKDLFRERYIFFDTKYF